MDLQTMIVSVLPLDEAAMVKARERQVQLAKPPGSLGRLEDLSVQLAGITGSVHNRIEKKACSGSILQNPGGFLHHHPRRCD